MTEFEKCLRYERTEKKMSQRDLAELAGMEAGDVSRLESGVFVFMDRGRIDRIARVIDTDSQMLWSMYTAEFRTELREMRRRKAAESAGDIGSAGTGKAHGNTKPNGSTRGIAGNNSVVMDEKAIAPVNDTFLAAELQDIGKEIMKLPDRTRNTVIPLIKMLVSSYGTSVVA